ncbi:MAG: hypothetical protein ACJA0H_002477 [Francisellaceae bacterium]|jgi:hypothetical protein
MIRLEKNHKYYSLDMTIDLLGDLVVTCFYGSLKSKHNHTQTHFVTDNLAAIDKITKIVNLRYKHGYDLLEDTENWL